MEKNEIKPLFGELMKQLKVIGMLLTAIIKVLVNRVEKSAGAKVKTNPMTTLIATSSILTLLLIITNLGWFVKYKVTVKNDDYIEMEVSKRVDQEKIRIEAEANELAFDRYQVRIDSLTQEIISLKSRKISNAGYKKSFSVNAPSDNKIKEDVKDNKTVSKETNKTSNGDDFAEVKE